VAVLKVQRGKILVARGRIPARDKFCLDDDAQVKGKNA